MRKTILVLTLMVGMGRASRGSTKKSLVVLRKIRVRRSASIKCMSWSEVETVLSKASGSSSLPSRLQVAMHYLWPTGPEDAADCRYELGGFEKNINGTVVHTFENRDFVQHKSTKKIFLRTNFTEDELAPAKCHLNNTDGESEESGDDSDASSICGARPDIEMAVGEGGQAGLNPDAEDEAVDDAIMTSISRSKSPKRKAQHPPGQDRRSSKRLNST
jgi:hypothetical protein